MVYFQCLKHVFLFLPVFSMFLWIYTQGMCVMGILLGKTKQKLTDLHVPTLFFSSPLRQYNNFLFCLIGEKIHLGYTHFKGMHINKTHSSMNYFSIAPSLTSSCLLSTSSPSLSPSSSTPPPSSFLAPSSFCTLPWARGRVFSSGFPSGRTRRDPLLRTHPRRPGTSEAFCGGIVQIQFFFCVENFSLFCWLRTRRVLTLFNNVLLRTRRALSP